MTRTLAIITALAALLIPNAAAASYCATLKEVRAVYPTQYLSYRLEGRRSGGAKCWSAPGHAAVVKVKSKGKSHGARIHAVVHDIRVVVRNNSSDEDVAILIPEPAPNPDQLRLDLSFSEIGRFMLAPWHHQMWEQLVGLVPSTQTESHHR